MRLVDVVRQLWSDLSAQRLRTVPDHTRDHLGHGGGGSCCSLFSVGLERQTLKRFHGLGDRNRRALRRTHHAGPRGGSGRAAQSDCAKRMPGSSPARFPTSR